jgi:hypothetical protein
MYSIHLNENTRVFVYFYCLFLGGWAHFPDSSGNCFSARLRPKMKSHQFIVKFISPCCQSGEHYSLIAFHHKNEGSEGIPMG